MPQTRVFSWREGGSVFFYIVTDLNQEPQSLEPLMWIAVGLATLRKVKSVYTLWVTAFCSQILGKIHTFQGHCLFWLRWWMWCCIPGGQCASPELGKRTPNLWVGFEAFKPSYHLWGEADLSCRCLKLLHWQRDLIRIKNSVFSCAETHLVGVPMATPCPEGNTWLKPFIWIYLSVQPFKVGFILRKS